MSNTRREFYTRHLSKEQLLARACKQARFFLCAEEPNFLMHTRHICKRDLFLCAKEPLFFVGSSNGQSSCAEEPNLCAKEPNVCTKEPSLFHFFNSRHCRRLQEPYAFNAQWGGYDSCLLEIIRSLLQNIVSAIVPFIGLFCKRDL